MKKADDVISPGVPNWILRIIRGIGDYAVEILNGILTVLAVWAGFFGEKLFWDGWYIFGLILLCVTLLIWAYIRRKSYNTLRKKQVAAETKAERRFAVLEDSIHTLLKNILSDFDIDDMDTRASAYVFDKDDQGAYFALVSRYSQNPSLDENQRKPERYSVTKGILSKGWIEGSGYYAVNRLPKDREEWNKTLTAKYNYTYAEAAAIKMRSSTIGAFRIHDNTKNEKAVGLLVVESKNSDKLLVTLLDAVYGSSLWHSFSQIMSGFAPLIPKSELMTLEPDTPPVEEESQDEWEST